MAEFWNVCTRPASARGGLGLTVDESERRLRVIERIAAILPEDATVYARWRALVLGNAVMGTSVHDARLVALMDTHMVTHLLTLNAGHFHRYGHITVLTPAQVGPPATT